MRARVWAGVKLAGLVVGVAAACSAAVASFVTHVAGLKCEKDVNAAHDVAAHYFEGWLKAECRAAEWRRAALAREVEADALRRQAMFGRPWYIPALPEDDTIPPQTLPTRAAD